MRETKRTQRSVQATVPPEASRRRVGAAPAPRTAGGVAELLRRLAQTEEKLAEVDRERSSDAEMIGRLLAEVADRDRRLGELQARVAEDEERLRALQEALARMQEEHARAVELARSAGNDDRIRELEETVARGDAVLAALQERLAKKREPEPTGELADLVAALGDAVAVTRATMGGAIEKLQQTKDAASTFGVPEVERGLAGTLSQAKSARDWTEPVDGAVERLLARFREIEEHQDAIARLRKTVIEETRAVLSGMETLQDALGKVVEPRKRPPPPKRT